jgi:hypothetical protein
MRCDARRIEASDVPWQNASIEEMFVGKLTTDWSPRDVKDVSSLSLQRRASNSTLYDFVMPPK